MKKRKPASHSEKPEFYLVDFFELLEDKSLAEIDCSVFSLKAGDTAIKQYEFKNIQVQVIPTTNGRASIYDKDVWLYCIALYIHRLKTQSASTEKSISFTAHDFLISTGKRADGDSYRRLLETIDKLLHTQVQIIIQDEDEIEQILNYHFIESWEVIEHELTGRMSAIKITFPDWLCAALKTSTIPTLNINYFKLRKPLERRAYELARKYCANQAKWSVSLDELYDKSGSTATTREFRRLMKMVARQNKLPDYQLRYDAYTDYVNFYNHGKRGYKAQIRDLVSQLNRKRIP